MMYFVSKNPVPTTLVCVDCGNDLTVIRVPFTPGSPKLGVVKCICVPKTLKEIKEAKVINIDRFRGK